MRDGEAFVAATNTPPAGRPASADDTVVWLGADKDPFRLGETLLPDVDDGTVVLAGLEPRDKVLEPSEPSRSICRIPDGRLCLVETRPKKQGGPAGNSWEQVRIGLPVSFDQASELALMILTGNTMARCLPHALNALALAYLGARIAAERRKALSSAAADTPAARRPAAAETAAATKEAAE